MRKTSQDGGDSTSITSGIENEVKKSADILKCKRNSLKRKVQNLSHESDETVIEPLLQKDKEKTANESAKYNLLSKTKTDTISETGTDKDKLIPDEKNKKSALYNDSGIMNKMSVNSVIKDNTLSKLTSANTTLHNHMHTNVFSTHDALKGFVAPKSQILVEIDGTKQVGYSPSPLIFTTAKIHTDGKTKQREPVHVTPVPILSTIELGAFKSGSNKGETSGDVNSSNSTICTNIPKTNINITEKCQAPSVKIVDTTCLSNKDVDSKIPISSNNIVVSEPYKNLTTSIVKNDAKIDQSYSVKEKAKLSESVAIENKKDKDENKFGIPANSSASDKFKTAFGNEIVKPEATSASTSKPKTSNITKNKGIVNEAVKGQQNDRPKYIEKNIDINKNINQDGIDSLTSKVSENLRLSNNIVKSDDKTNKDKILTNTSSSGKQLQRQSIVVDKEPNPKLSMDSSHLSNNFHKSSENTIINSSTQKNSTVDEVNSFSGSTEQPLNITMGLNKTSTPRTDVTVNKTSAPINITSSNKILTSITNSGTANKTSATINTVAASKTSTFTTTAASVDKKSAPITTTAPSKSSTSTATAPTVHKPPTTINTSSASKTSVSVTTSAAVSKKSIPIATTATINKISDSMTTSASIDKSSASNIPTTSVNINDTIKTITSGANKTLVSASSATSAKKTIAPITTATATYSTSDIPIMTSSNGLSQSSITSAHKPDIPTTSSVLPSRNIPGNISKSGTTKASTTIVPKISSASNTKPLSSITSAKSMKASSIVSPNTTTEVKSTAATIENSAITKTTPLTSIVKSTENTTRSSTSNARTSTGNSTAPVKVVTATQGLPNVTPFAINTTSTSSSSKPAESNKQSDSKTNVLSSGSKSSKA